MTRRPPALVLLLAALAGPVATLAAERPELETIVLPRLAGADPAVIEQLESAHREIAGLTADPQVAVDDLATAYGRLGRLLMVYDQAESARLAFTNARRLAADDFSWSYLAGVTEQQLSLLEEAARSFERTLELAGDDLPALIRLGQTELALGRRGAASERFGRVLALDPGNAAALYGIGQLAYLEGDWAEAARRYEAAVAQQPDAATAHYQLGLTYRELGELDRARSHLARGGRGEVRFEDPLLRDLGSLARGSSVLVVQATRARARGDLDGAIAGFRAALASDPDLTTARLALASALSETGRALEAVAELEEALRRDPGNPAALYNLGTLLASRGELERAVELLRQATENAPRFLDAWVNLGGQLATLGRFAEAQEALANAVELDPGDHAARLMHAESLARLERWESALDEVQQVLRRDPGNAAAGPGLLSILLRAARAAGANGEMAAAAERYREALAIDPENREARYGRTVALLLARDYDAALAHLEESLDRLPGDTQLETALARLLAACPDAAIRDGERALLLAQRVVARELVIEHAETVAMALAELGRFDQAVAVQERVVGQAEQFGDPAVLARLRHNLGLYRTLQPVREPWLTNP